MSHVTIIVQLREPVHYSRRGEAVAQAVAYLASEVDAVTPPFDFGDITAKKGSSTDFESVEITLNVHYEPAIETQVSALDRVSVA